MRARLPYFALSALALSVFANVTAQFLPAGMFPEMSESFGVSEADLGVLIAVYAASCVIAGPPLVHLTRNLPRKPLLLVSIAAMAIVTFATAAAPNFLILAVLRVIGGALLALSQSVIGGYVARLVPKTSLNRANAIVTGGGVASSLTAVPLGIALGDSIGWQGAFLVLATAIVVMGTLVAVLVPPVALIADADAHLAATAIRHDRTVRPVLLFCTASVLVGGGHFTFYTYVDPYLSTVAGLAPAMISTLLLVFAVAGILGLVVSGLIGDLAPRRILLVTLIGAMIGVGAIAIWPTVIGVSIVAFALWGFCLGINPVIIQSLVMHTASPRIRDVAASWLNSAANLGIGAGALLGAAVLGVASVSATPVVAEIVWLVALVMIPLSIRAADRASGAGRV